MFFRRDLPLLALALSLAATPAYAANAGSLPEMQYALPAMPLGEALRQAARQGGVNLLVDDRLVAGKRSQELAGTFTPETAVAALLRDTGLQVRIVEGSLIVSAVAPGAQPGQRRGNVADEVIIVTGSNVRGALPTSPVITISRKDIERSAPGSAEELMRKLPQNVSGGVASENITTPGTGADITDHGAGANLRGLGQRATLTLLNGRRLAPSGSGSYVDISLIPITAVERVEIVTDGASAIYGSDAVGGVVNFILRDDFEGMEAVAQAGTTTRGGGSQLLLGATAGKAWSSGHALASYEYRRDEEILAKDRSFTIGLPDQWSLFPRERRHSLFGLVAQDIDPDLSVEVSGLFADRRTTRSFFVAGPVVPVEGVARATSLGGTAALKWRPGAGWTIEASAGWYRSKTEEEQNQPLGQGLYNRFDSENRVASFGLKADGDLFELPGGTVKVALGGEYRREQYRSTFETLVNPANPESGSRNVSSLFGELFIPVVGPGNRMPGLQKLVLTAAARVDHYSGLKASIDPKLGLLWSPLPGLDFRTSYSTSFRAPLLSETLGYYNVYLFPSPLLYLDPSTAVPGVGAALVGANPDVSPERSKSWTIGFDWKPVSVSGLKLSASYYNIRFSNRIAQPTDMIVVVGNPALAPIVTLHPDTGDVTSLLDGAGQVLDFSGPGFTNGGATPQDVVLLVDVRTSNTAETRTSGLDVGASYDWTVGRHTFNAYLNANRVFRFDDWLTSASPAIETLNTVYHPVDWRFRTGLAWTFGDVSTNVAVNYTNGYRDKRGTRNDKVASFTTLDAGLAYDFGGRSHGVLNRFRVALNVQNLLDQKPPRLAPDPGYTRGTGYDPVNATARGRYISLQLRKAF